MPPTEDEEFYCEDLVGLAVETVNGKSLGNVLSFQEFGAGAMLEIGRRHGDTTLVPFTKDIVPQVDLEAKRVVIDPPPGLLEPIAKEDPERGLEKVGGVQ